MRRESTWRARPTRSRFDVVCAGEAHWRIHREGAAAGAARPLDLRGGGGALQAALVLRRWGLSVGLATAVEDDTFGRALVERIALRGVDTSGVVFAPAKSELVVVEATSRSHEVVAAHDVESPLEIPEEWTARVLLLAGLSPVVSYGAALCKAARSARRAGTPVVVTIDARPSVWRGRDPRAIRMVLREADVVRCSEEDLELLKLDLPALRASLRHDTVVLMIHRNGHAWAMGPFGDTRHVRRDGNERFAWGGEGDAFAAAVCAELARSDAPVGDRIDLWERVLRRGQAEARQATSA